jgi:thiamine-phosphate pyrophosphorylase
MSEAKTPPCKLYLITPAKIDPNAFAEDLKAAIDAAPDAVGAVQLRLKDVPDEDIIAGANVLMPICHAADIPLIINDRADIAQATGADGVHLGQDDGSLADARTLLGKDAIIGVTCHDSRDLAIEAGDGGADYVAFGAFFPTTSKDAKHQADPDIVEWWSTMTIVPCVAIGGITPENCGPLVEAGADYLAVINGVWGHPGGPAEAVRAFAPRIKR